MNINTVRYQGSPPEQGNRTQREWACYQLLDHLKISYDRVDHDPADTIADCHEVEKVLGAPICKNLFLCNRQKTSFYLLLMEGDKPFRTKDLSKEIGSSRLSFAPPEELETYLGVMPGSASVLGLMKDEQHQVRLLVDAPVLEEAYLGCHPCQNTSSLRIPMEEVREILLPHLGVTPEIVHLPDVRLEES